MVYNRNRNRGMALRPVNRIKHVVDDQGALVANTSTGINLIATTDTPTLAATKSVETGSRIYGIYLKLEMVSTSGTGGTLVNAYMILYKNPGNNISAPAPNAVGSNDDKRYVIHQEMVMLDHREDSLPRTLFNGVIPFPKHLQRNGPNDNWNLQLLTPGGSSNYCIQCHFKEFR